MQKNKIKAIFYAYSNNALDHLAPYAVLCKIKKIESTIVFGEDFIRQKVRPKTNILKILKDYKIEIYNIPNFKNKGFVNYLFFIFWNITKFVEEKNFLTSYLSSKLKGLCNKLYNHLDRENLGKTAAKNLIKKSKNIIVFTDEWNTNKQIQNSFLLYFKKKFKIISTGHAVWHANNEIKKNELTETEDIALLSNNWELERKKIVPRREVIGSIRFSKKWLSILDQYSDEKVIKNNNKINVSVLTHSEKHTSSWKRMFNLLNELSKRKDIALNIVPHIRGMSNLKPPESLKKNWNSKSSLDTIIKNSDLVLFWESSAVFEAVVRNKKILYLSFLSVRDQKYLWQKKANPDIIIKNEHQLFKTLDNYKKNIVIDNSSFKEIIWPKGDPWSNATDFLKSIINF